MSPELTKKLLDPSIRQLCAEHYQLYGRGYPYPVDCSMTVDEYVTALKQRIADKKTQS